MEAQTLGRRESRKEERRRQILDIAERSFFGQGFAATSMSAIAAEIGGSKTTLWSYFPSKEALFVALLDRRIGAFGAALGEALLAGGSLRPALTRFGEVYLERVLAEDSRALRGLVGAEGARFPALAAVFWEHGPSRVLAKLARYLGVRMAAGELRPGDAAAAARQFVALCQSGAFLDHIWHRPDPPAADVPREAARAVDSFLRAWAPLSPAAPAPCTRPG